MDTQEFLEFGVGNYYGGLSAIKYNNKFYWSVEDYDGYDWEEIPEYLYNALAKFNDEEDK